MTSGGQCVMTLGTALMLLWSASNWDMHTQEVSLYKYFLTMLKINSFCESQLARHLAMATLVLAVDQSSLMMFTVPQVPTSY